MDEFSPSEFAVAVDEDEGVVLFVLVDDEVFS